MKAPAAIIAIAALMAATPAAAQLAPGRSGSSTTITFSGQAAWEGVVNFGRCYATRNTKGALKLIATEPGTQEEVTVYKALFRNPNQTCLGFTEWLSAPYQMIRGAIADGLYYGRVPLPPEMLLTAPEPAAVRDLSGTARCFVKANEADARALGETDPGSKPERAIMERIAPAFANCLPPGVRISFDGTLIRFRIVEAMFRTGVVRQKAAGN